MFEKSVLLNKKIPYYINKNLNNTVFKINGFIIDLLHKELIYRALETKEPTTTSAFTATSVTSATSATSKTSATRHTNHLSSFVYFNIFSILHNCSTI